MFVIKDEAVREQLSKDCTLMEAVRSLAIQMNENGKYFKDKGSTFSRKENFF